MSQSSIQTIVIEAFKRYFTIDTVSLDKNFFDLGVNSFELTLICADISEKLGNEVSILSFYENPTIAMLAEFLEKERESN